MQNIQNIADESSDDEGFEVDENAEAEDLDPPQKTSESSSSYDRGTSSSSDRGTGIPMAASHESDSEPEDEVVEGSTIGQDSQIDAVDLFAQRRKVPLSHQVDLSGHAKAVTCISVEPAGNRLVTGSLDYGAKLYDFGGMDSRHRAFRSIEVQDGYPVTALSHSPSGDRFIVGTGSSQPKVYDREGVELMKFVKGDMYLRDLANTKGHTMEVTGVAWHPIDKNVVLTSSLDGSVRIWDLLGESTFGNLCSKHVLKIRGATGQNRVGATSCCYTPNGLRMIGGANDGSIHIWQERKVYSKPDLLIRMAHPTGTLVTSVMTSSTGTVLASRGDDGSVRVWDIAGQLSQSTKMQTPLKCIPDLMNLYPSANVAFSPDDSLLCCGTSPVRSDPTSKSMLLFFEVKKKKDEGEKAEGPVLQIAVEGGGVSAIMVKWLAETNQILCSTSAGNVKVFFDPRLSKKGALLTAGKAPKKREKEAEDQTVVGEIFYPHALPLFKVEMADQKRIREKNDPMKTKMPNKQLDKGPGNKPNMSFFFTQYVTDGVKVNNMRAEDPRAALLAMDEKAKSDPIFFGRAYNDSNPKNVLHTQTFEEEQEEFKKRQKRL